MGNPGVSAQRVPGEIDAHPPKMHVGDVLYNISN